MGSVASLRMRGPFLAFAKRRHRGRTFLKRQLAIQRSYLKVDALPDNRACGRAMSLTAAQERIWNYREPEGLSHAAKTKAREV